MKKMLIFTVLLILCSCKGSSPKSASPTTIFDPTSPDSNSTNNRIPGVLNLAVTLDTIENKATLTWLVPSSYNNQDYKIYVYRITGDGISTTIDDPATPYSISDYYYPTSTYTPFKGSVFADSTFLNSGSQYTYYVYIKNGDNWSYQTKVTLAVGLSVTPNVLPTAANFWPSYTQTIGKAPYSPTAISDTTLSPGIATSANPTGGCALAFGGGVMYCADTANNRVVIYQSGAYQNCDKNFLEPLGIYDLCLSLYKGYPFIAMAVLGQKDMFSNDSCATGTLSGDSCFTRPSGVMVADGRLFVSDTGNNRVMIHSTLPINGCFNVLELGGTSFAHQCSFSGVVGKKSLNDNSTYSLGLNGQSSLNAPSGLAYKSGANALEGDLYIADTGNNRLVVAKKVLQSNYWKCNDNTWGTSLCSFGGLLGQADYNSRKNFSDEYHVSHKYSYDTFNHDVRVDVNGEAVSDNGFFLSRYFASPNRIAINGDNLLISSNENFTDLSTTPSIALKSRIIVYKNNPLAGVSPACTLNDFNTLTSKCAYDYAIGQAEPKRLVETDVSQNGEYQDNAYSLTDVDFALNGNTMFGIDRKLNRVYIWSDYKSRLDSVTGLPDNSGTPYDFYVNNPAGIGENLNGKILPDLQNLNDIMFDSNSGSLYIQDSQLGHIYLIPILNH